MKREQEIKMTLNEFETWFYFRKRRTSSRFNVFAMIISDLISVMLSFGSGFFLVNLYDFEVINFRSFVMYWPYVPVFIIIFILFGLYPGISLAPSEELRRVFISGIIAYGAIIISRYIEDSELDWITVAFVVSFCVSTLIILQGRAIMRHLLSSMRLGGIPAVIYGGGVMGRALVDKLISKPLLGYAPVLILDDDVNTGDEYRSIPVIHDTKLGPEIVRRFNIKMAIVAINHIKRKDLVSLMNNSVSAFRYNILIPDFFGLTTIWMSARDFDGILGIATTQKLKIPLNRFAKRFMDCSVVVLGGLIIMPFLLLIAICIKLNSRGPALYKHTRIGINGKEFKTYKFRTMVQDADKRLAELLLNDSSARAEWEATQKLKNDPRVTPFGRLLRKLSIDEFPQLLNVLRGEMSLVGPRPIVRDEIEKYGEDFSRIFSLKPGITGLWQISGRSDTGYTDRVSFDTYYSQNWSVWLDLWILYRTAGVVLAGRGAY
jgi:Undecaprenyl-phosphate galactose phosphotransferase WbaP